MQYTELAPLGGEFYGDEGTQTQVLLHHSPLLYLRQAGNSEAHLSQRAGAITPRWLDSNWNSLSVSLKP